MERAARAERVRDEGNDEDENVVSLPECSDVSFALTRRTKRYLGRL
jgi:hypothetical protein